MSNNVDEELASFKLQLQQVEAALLGDPSNEELITLRTSLEEIIQLQEDLKAEGAATGESSGIGSSSVPQSVNHIWKVGERVMAPLPDGRRVMAKIDSLTPAGAAITFISNGQQTIVDTSELQLPPEGQRKNFAFEKNKNYVFDKSKNQQGKKEWHAEREHRKLRAQKKELKRKELDTAKEKEKTSWQKFNNKALNKGMKGLKKVTATSSAQDGPAHGMKRETTISSRANEFQLRSTRGAMDSLF